MEFVFVEADFPPLPVVVNVKSASSPGEENHPAVIMEDDWREPGGGDTLEDFYSKMWRIGMEDANDPRFYFDCKFWVGEGDAKVVVRAHRFFLSLHSEVFCDILSRVEAYWKEGREASELEALVTFPDLNPIAFTAMLNYLYIGSFFPEDPTEDISIAEMKEIMEVAEKFKLKKLLHDCAALLTKLIPAAY